MQGIARHDTINAIDIIFIDENRAKPKPRPVGNVED
jgi:hypothetical protein